MAAVWSVCQPAPGPHGGRMVSLQPSWKQDYCYSELAGFLPQQ